MTGPLTRPFRDRRFRRLVWVIVAVVGWVGLVALGAALLAETPPKAGFDLGLVLDAGRRVAAGLSPYAPGAVTSATQAEDLFFSYPPPIAQVASLFGGLSIGVALALSAIGATAGLGVVAAGLAGGWRRSGAVDVVLPTLALAPYVYPFAVALLFGNVDAWFPLVYGAVLVALVRGRGGGRWAILAGIALGLATLAKLYPGVLLGWLAIRGLRTWLADRYATRRPLPREWGVLVVAVVTLAVVAGVSVAVYGPGPWEDYAAVLRSGVSAQLAGALNIGLSSQLALLAGAPSVAAQLAPVVGAGVLLTIPLDGWFVRRTSLSLALAAVASLLVSPITWFHYPVALLPFAVAAWVGARGTGSLRSAGVGGSMAVPVAGLLLAAVVVAGASIVLPVAVWIAVVLVLAALAISPDVELSR